MRRVSKTIIAIAVLVFLAAATPAGEMSSKLDGCRWVQVFPMGSAKSTDGRKMFVGPTEAGLIIKYWSEKTVQTPVFYQHGLGPRGEAAAGWILSMQIRQNGVWVYVWWTELALGEIRAGMWGAISPRYLALLDKNKVQHPVGVIEISLVNLPAIDALEPPDFGLSHRPWFPPTRAPQQIGRKEP